MCKRVMAAVLLLIAAGFVLSGCQTTKRNLKQFSDNATVLFFDGDQFDKEVR